MTSPDKEQLTEPDTPTAERSVDGPIPGQGASLSSSLTATERSPELDSGEEDVDSRHALDLLPAEPVPARGRSWRWAWVCGVVVLALCASGLWWHSTRERPASLPAATPAAQHGLFVAVSAPDGKLVDGLYYVDGDASMGVFVPGDLMLDAPSLGTVPLSDVLPLGTDVPAVAFADATGLRVDDSWSVPMDGLAALVDKVGGVVVDVDAAVQTDGVQIAAGPAQKLDGTHALTFATWTAAGEASSAQLARLGQVTSTLISSLPAEDADIEELLAGVPGSTTGSTAELADRLLDQRAALRAANPASTLLPVTDSPTPQVPTGVVVDNASLQTFVSAHAPGVQQRRPGVGGSVALQNASGVDQLELNARRLLVDAGFTFTWRGLAEPAQDVTMVLVPTSDTADLDLGRRVAKDLGLPGAQVVAAPAIVPVGQDAMVLLGADFSAVDLNQDPTSTASQGPTQPAPAEQSAPDEPAPTP